MAAKRRRDVHNSKAFASADAEGLRRPPRRTGPSPSLKGIRWDRLTRLGLLVALLLVLLSYVGPATNYWESWHLNRETRADVQTLREDNARLRERARDARPAAAGGARGPKARHGTPRRTGVRRARPAAGPLAPSGPAGPASLPPMAAPVENAVLQWEDGYARVRALRAEEGPASTRSAAW